MCCVMLLRRNLLEKVGAEVRESGENPEHCRCCKRVSLTFVAKAGHWAKV